MLRSRRSGYLLFHCQDGVLLDVDALLRGDVPVEFQPRLSAISILRGEAVAIERDELETVLEFPSGEWVDVEPSRAAEIEALARKGLLVVDGADDEELDELRLREETLAANEWNLYAAAYHFLTRWRDVDVMADGVPEVSAAQIEKFVDRFGPPPDTFHELAPPRPVLELPLDEREGELYRVLLRRKTTRAFDAETDLELDKFSTVLRYVFGAHAWAPFVGDLFGIQRTSPSGGGLHPVEAYPLVSRVEGVEPGLYHYRVRDHALELVVPLEADKASGLATKFVSGQSYLGAAHVNVILTARYYRSFWKYRRHQKAYATLLMDAAHLSQTLYLVAAELGLGAYVTAAINSATIDEKLGLDPASEGALAVVGFGCPSNRPAPIEPNFRPYQPRETAPPG
jgi:putative peptide maturation dehydrogenase